MLGCITFISSICVPRVATDFSFQLWFLFPLGFNLLQAFAATASFKHGFEIFSFVFPSPQKAKTQRNQQDYSQVSPPLQSHCWGGVLHGEADGGFGEVIWSHLKPEPRGLVTEGAYLWRSRRGWETLRENFLRLGCWKESEDEGRSFQGRSWLQIAGSQLVESQDPLHYQEVANQIICTAPKFI